MVFQEADGPSVPQDSLGTDGLPEDVGDSDQAVPVVGGRISRRRFIGLATAAVLGALTGCRGSTPQRPRLGEAIPATPVGSEGATPSPTPEEVLNVHGVRLISEVGAEGGFGVGGLDLPMLSLDEVRQGIAGILHGDETRAAGTALIEDDTTITVFTDSSGAIPCLLGGGMDRLLALPRQVSYGGRDYQFHELRELEEEDGGGYRARYQGDLDPDEPGFQPDEHNFIQINPMLDIPGGWHPGGCTLLRIENPDGRVQWRVLLTGIEERQGKPFLGTRERGPEPIWEWIGPEIPLTVNIEGESFESSIQFAIGEGTAFEGGDMIGPATQAGLRRAHQPVLDADIWSDDREDACGIFIAQTEDGWAIPRIEEMMAIVYPHLWDLIGERWQARGFGRTYEEFINRGIRFVFADHNASNLSPAEMEHFFGYLQSPLDNFNHTRNFEVGVDAQGKVIVVIPATEEQLRGAGITQGSLEGRSLRESTFICNEITYVLRGLNSDFWANNGDASPPNVLDSVRLPHLFNPFPPNFLTEIVSVERRGFPTEQFIDLGILILPSDSP